MTGSSQEMNVLEEFCRKHEVAVKRGVVSAYEGVAVTLFAVYITGTIEVIAQCIAAYRGARNEPLKVTCYVPGRGTMVVEDFSVNGVAKVLQTTDQLHVENDWA